MSLLTPDFGLMFWMALSFGVVFFIAAKWGFPVITRAVEERKKYIDDALKNADEANKQLANIKAEGDAILAEARKQQHAMLRDATKLKEDMLAGAKDAAQKETQKILEDARKQIKVEKETALAEIRSQVAVLAVDIAEKVLRSELKDEKSQLDLVNRLLDEVPDQKPGS